MFCLLGLALAGSATSSELPRENSKNFRMIGENGADFRLLQRPTPSGRAIQDKNLRIENGPNHRSFQGPQDRPNSGKRPHGRAIQDIKKHEG